MHNGTPIIDVTPDERPDEHEDDAPELLGAKPDAGWIILGIIVAIVGIAVCGLLKAQH